MFLRQSIALGLHPPLMFVEGGVHPIVKTSGNPTSPLRHESVDGVVLRRVLLRVIEHIFLELPEDSDVLRALCGLSLTTESECLARALLAAPPESPLLHFRSDPGPFLAGVPIKPLHLRGVQCLGNAA